MDAEIAYYTTPIEIKKVSKSISQNFGILLEGNTCQISSLLVTQDHKYVITAGLDRIIRIYHLLKNYLKFSLNSHTSQILKLLLTNKEDLLISAGSDSVIQLWSFHNKTFKASLTGHTKNLHDIKLSNNDKHLISSGFDSLLIIWNLSAHTAERIFITHIYAPIDFVITSDFRFIIACGDANAHIYDLNNLEDQYNIFHEDPFGLDLVAITSDSKTLIISQGSGGLKLFDFESRKLKATLFGHYDNLLQLFLTRYDKMLVSMSKYHTIKIWNMSELRLHYSFTYNSNFISSIIATNNGKYLITDEADGGVIVWDLESEGIYANFKGHSACVDNFNVTSDDKIVVSSSVNGMIKVWDLEEKREMKEFNAEFDHVKEIATKDGVWLAACGSMSVKVWDLKKQKTALHTVDIKEPSSISILREKYLAIGNLYYCFSYRIML